MGLAAGKMDRLLSLERAVQTRDEIGGMIETWQEVRRLWVMKLPDQTSETIQSGQITARMTARFRCRYFPDLALTDRLREATGRLWNIRHVGEIGRREGWDILAEAVE